MSSVFVMEGKSASSVAALVNQLKSGVISKQQLFDQVHRLHCLHCCCCLRAVASCRSCTNDPALSRNQTRIPPVARLPPPLPKRSHRPLSEAATSIPVREWFVQLDRLRWGSPGEREAKDGGISLTEAVRAMARPAGIPRLPVRC